MRKTLLLALVCTALCLSAAACTSRTEPAAQPSALPSAEPTAELTEKDLQELEDQLEKDKNARKYKDHKLPVASYAEYLKDPQATPAPDPEVYCTPAVLKIKIGETARFYTSVKNASTAPSYQWQYSADEGKNWADFAGQTDSMLAFEVTDANRNYVFQCVVRVDSIRLTGPVVRLDVEGGAVAGNNVESNGKPKISISPKLCKTSIGVDAVFTATVSNPRGDVAYQWQYSKNGGKSWKNAKYPGSNTAVMTVNVTSTIAKKYIFRCVAKTGGKKLTSKKAQIFAVKISASATDAVYGQKVKFTAAGYNYGGKTAKYQWQFSTDGGQTWQKYKGKGYKTKKITVTMDPDNINWYYRCRVKGKNGTHYTDAVHVNNITPAPTPEPTPVPTSQDRYAVVIANSNYDYQNDLPGVYNDGTAMYGALKALGWNVKLVRDATAYQMDSTIRSYFANTQEKDTCLVYYSGHGDNSTGSTAGALAGVDLSGYLDQLYTPAQMRDTLLSCTKGQVIIMLDSCGSGAGVYSNGSAKNFTKGVMNAFKGYLMTKDGAKTGEFLNNRFAVLAACEYGDVSQDGYMYEGTLYGRDRCILGSGGVFTYSLIRSMGCDYSNGAFSGSFAADSNKDGKLSLQEAYNGIRSRVQAMNDLLDKYDHIIAAQVNGEWGLYSYEGYIQQEVQMGGAGGAVLFP